MRLTCSGEGGGGATEAELGPPGLHTTGSHSHFILIVTRSSWAVSDIII